MLLAANRVVNLFCLTGLQHPHLDVYGFGPVQHVQLLWNIIPVSGIWSRRWHLV